MYAITSPVPQFFDLSGDPLDAGKIYIGTAGSNPITSPVTVYWDDAGTQPAAQPIRTVSGYPARNGKPARFYVATDDFSLTVMTRTDTLVQSELSVLSSATLRVDLADTASATDGAGMVAFNGTLNYAAATIGAVLNDICVNVKMFPWLAKGDGTTDDWAAIQAAFDFLPASSRILFPDGEYAVKKMLTQHKSGVTLQGTGKYSAKIIPRLDFERVTYDALLEVGTTGTNSHIVRDLGVLATYSNNGNDLSGLAINADYNVDIIDCYLQSGNEITRENGGLLIRSGKHTTITRTGMNNGYAYGALIKSHNVGLKFVTCAFDETPVAIKSDGNIVEMTVTADCSFGACAPNPVHPTTSVGSQIDLTTGAHTLVSITSNTFLGNVNTKISVDVNNVQSLTVDGNTFADVRRYAVCHRGSNQLVVSDNTFYGVGGDGSTNDPSAGTTNPDTSTFCCEVFKASAFNKSTTIVGNTTNNTARPMAWIEGSSGAPLTSATTVIGNNAQGGAAYVHGVTVADSRPFINGRRLIDQLVPVSFTIPTLSYTAGQTRYGNFVYPGLAVTDVIQASADINLIDGMILNVRVLSAGLGRWIVTNSTGGPQTPPDVTAVAVATRA